MYTVVCFGDTNTWGYDNRSGDRLPYDERWTGMLAKELGTDFRVIEEGLPGRATTEDPVEPGKNAREQIGPCLESHAPGPAGRSGWPGPRLVYRGGWNDLYLGVSHKQTMGPCEPTQRFARAFFRLKCVTKKSPTVSGRGENAL